MKPPITFEFIEEITIPRYCDKCHEFILYATYRFCPKCGAGLKAPVSIPVQKDSELV